MPSLQITHCLLLAHGSAPPLPPGRPPPGGAGPPAPPPPPGPSVGVPSPQDPEHPLQSSNIIEIPLTNPGPTKGLTDDLGDTLLFPVQHPIDPS